MCNIKYILCTIFCMCAYLHAAAICSDSISDKFSYKVLENFNYCWDNNNIVYEDTNSKDTALFVSSHKYIISYSFPKRKSERLIIRMPSSL